MKQLNGFLLLRGKKIGVRPQNREEKILIRALKDIWPLLISRAKGNRVRVVLNFVMLNQVAQGSKHSSAPEKLSEPVPLYSVLTLLVYEMRLKQATSSGLTGLLDRATGESSWLGLFVHSTRRQEGGHTQ